jgi:glycerol uptake facilitator-like aquaporin
VLTGIFIAVILQASQKGAIGLVAIPLTLVVVHLAGIPFSGASVNPARSLGSALVGGNWHAYWIYIAGPAIGAVGAWLVHTLVVKGEMPSAPATS